MALRMPAAMLFIRSSGREASHRAHETVKIEDVASLDVRRQFIEHLGSHYASTWANYMKKAVAIIHAAPAIGAGFTRYTAELDRTSDVHVGGADSFRHW